MAVGMALGLQIVQHLSMPCNLQPIAEVSSDQTSNHAHLLPQSLSLLMQFDEAMNKALEKEVTTRTTFKGHLDSYRFCDQVPVSVMMFSCGTQGIPLNAQASFSFAAERCLHAKAACISIICVLLTSRLW